MGWSLSGPEEPAGLIDLVYESRKINIFNI